MFFFRSNCWMQWPAKSCTSSKICPRCVLPIPSTLQLQSWPAVTKVVESTFSAPVPTSWCRPVSTSFFLPHFVCFYCPNSIFLFIKMIVKRICVSFRLKGSNKQRKWFHLTFTQVWPCSLDSPSTPTWMWANCPEKWRLDSFLRAFKYTLYSTWFKCIQNSVNNL